MKKLLTTALVLALCAGLCSCADKDEERGITIASKQFTENILLSEMYAQLIESRTDLTVSRKQSLGTTAVCFPEMTNGAVDFYVEYTGTIYIEILHHEQDGMTAEERYNIAKEEMNGSYDIAVYQSIGLNNTYALVMRRDKAEALGISRMSDVSAVAHKLVFGANDLFYTRFNDGYDTMVALYGMRFKSTVKMNSTALYEAVNNDQVDVMVAYATDSLLTKNDMVILEDDLHLFPDYYAVPMLSGQTLRKYPELGGIMDLLAGRIDDECMQQLNYQVDIENKSPDEVASVFLAKQGLLP